MNKYQAVASIILLVLIFSPAPATLSEKIGECVLLAAYGALCYAWGIEDDEQVHSDTQ